MSRVLGYLALGLVIFFLGRAVIYDPAGSAQFVKHVGHGLNSFACHLHACPGGQP